MFSYDPPAFHSLLTLLSTEAWLCALETSKTEVLKKQGMDLLRELRLSEAEY